jgi:hypothetical protein
MWNIKKAQSSEETGTKQPSLMMNPYEITKQELMKKIKFMAIYVTGIVVVPKLLRGLGFIEPLGIPLTRR